MVLQGVSVAYRRVLGGFWREGVSCETLLRGSEVPGKFQRVSGCFMGFQILGACQGGPRVFYRVSWGSQGDFMGPYGRVMGLRELQRDP